MIRGVIKNWDSNESSEEDLRKALKETISLDFFGRVGRRTAIYLDIIIAAATFTVDSMDNSIRIKDPSEYFFTARLAYQWSRLLRVRPTSMNLDKDDEGTTFEPTPFQEFVRALPLNMAIRDETVRTVVALVREFPLKERQK